MRPLLFGQQTVSIGGGNVNIRDPSSPARDDVCATGVARP
jgi:hypothetical protein